MYKSLFYNALNGILVNGSQAPTTGVSWRQEPRRILCSAAATSLVFQKKHISQMDAFLGGGRHGCSPIDLQQHDHFRQNLVLSKKAFTKDSFTKQTCRFVSTTFVIC